jgi:hypothetical protein
MDATEAKPAGISPEAMAELEEVVARIMRGERDPEAMRLAAERMDRTREEMRQRVGIVDIAVQLIREGRDEE